MNKYFFTTALNSFNYQDIRWDNTTLLQVEANDSDEAELIVLEAYGEDAWEEWFTEGELAGLLQHNTQITDIWPDGIVVHPTE